MPIRVKPHKYGAKPQTVDGIRFASTKEAKRYGELRLLEKAGEIQELKLQPEFPLCVDGTRIGVYRADFEYVETRTWDLAIEDVKGVKTPLYKWKKKHVEAQFGITIREL